MLNRAKALKGNYPCLSNLLIIYKTLRDIPKISKPHRDIIV